MSPIPPPLFTLPIPPTGTLTCTQPAPKTYLLTFDSPPDNRLTPSFCTTLHLALDILLHRFPKGVVITTSGIRKFYSNGLDYRAAVEDVGFFEGVLYPLWRRLLTYPMPTLALLNGHAFAAGFMTAMMHDYRAMNPHHGFVCLNELEFHAGLLPPMASIFRDKVPSPNTYRALVLEAKRFTAPECLRDGLVDSLGQIAETLAFVADARLVEKAASASYGRLKEEMWCQTVALLDRREGPEVGAKQAGRELQRREGEARRRVEEWWGAVNAGKSRL